LLEQYFIEDPGFIWESAPKPRLTEASFYDPDFWIKFEQLSEEQKWLTYGAKRRWNLTEAEPLFDAADVGRFGKDLFVQRSTVTNAAGIDWLRRHYSNHRIHEVNFYNNAPMHIDVAFVPLRPGLVLSNKMREPTNEKMVELFMKNDWEIVPSALPAHYKKGKMSFSSIWLSMNILVLDPKTVCVEASEVEQMEQLDKLGFEVIPVPLWETSAFGGGLHCATADIYREGTLEDYFPIQVPGY
jgi:glycine amidinotransferase